MRHGTSLVHLIPVSQALAFCCLELETLLLRQCQISDKGVLALSQCSHNLQHLDVRRRVKIIVPKADSDTSSDSSESDDSGIGLTGTVSAWAVCDLLDSCPHMQSLLLGGCADLSDLPQLEEHRRHWTQWKSSEASHEICATTMSPARQVIRLMISKIMHSGSGTSSSSNNSNNGSSSITSLDLSHCTGVDLHCLRMLAGLQGATTQGSIAAAARAITAAVGETETRKSDLEMGSMGFLRSLYLLRLSNLRLLTLEQERQEIKEQLEAEDWLEEKNGGGTRPGGKKSSNSSFTTRRITTTVCHLIQMTRGAIGPGECTIHSIFLHRSYYHQSLAPRLGSPATHTEMHRLCVTPAISCQHLLCDTL